MKAVYIEQTGGLDALRYGDFPDAQAGLGEVLVKVAYSGVNFIDTYHRAGLYPLPLARSARVGGRRGRSSRWEKASPDFTSGDHVAYAMARGSYAEHQAVPARVPGEGPADGRFETGRGGDAAGHDGALSCRTRPFL